MYDLASDPGERSNLAGEQPSLTRQLQQTAVRHYTRHTENWSQQVKYKKLVCILFMLVLFFLYQLPSVISQHLHDLDH